MTAEGTACNGGGEAPKAELAAAKEVAGAASPEERPAEEREGVGGPFVIVNGDSDSLSDRGSDMGAGPEADSPSDEEDRPRSNAGSDAVAGGDHGTAGEESSALDAALGVSSADGHGRTAVEPEDAVGEGKGERSADFVAELVEQGTACGELLGGADAPAASGIDHADAGADSAAPAVDSVVDGKESTREKSAATDVTELLVHEAASKEQQGGVNAAAESSGQDDIHKYSDSSSTVVDSEVCGEDSKGEQSAAEIMELGADGLGALIVNGHHDANMTVDSCVTATEPVSHATEGKQQHGFLNVKEVVEQDATCSEHDVTNALQGNGHDHVDRSAGSCTSASEFNAHADEGKGQQSGQQIGAPTIDAEVPEGKLDASSSDCGACTCEEPIEEEVVANGHVYAEDNADASGELGPGVEDAEGEGNHGAVELEDRISKGDEGNLRDGHTADVVFSDEEAKPPVKERISEDVSAVVEMGVRTEEKNEEIVQGDDLVKDDFSVCILHSEKQESDPFVVSSGDQKIQVEVADENVTVSDVKADIIVEMNTTDSVQTQELRTAFEDRSVPLHVNSSGEVEETEVKKPACLEEGYLAENDYSSVQIGNPEQLEALGVGLADKSDNGVVEAEPRKEAEMEVVDAVPLQAAAASTFHNEPRSIDLVGNGGINHPSPDTELESCDHIQTEECSSREISSTTADQVTSGASMELGAAVTDDTELSYETGDASQDKSSETAGDQGAPIALSEDEAVVVEDATSSASMGHRTAVIGDAELSYGAGDATQEKSSETAVGQDEPVNLSEHEAVVVDDVKPSFATRDESAVAGEAGDVSKKEEWRDFGSNSKGHKDQQEICDTSTTRGDLSSTTGDKGSSIIELVSPNEEPCLSDVTLEPGVNASYIDKEKCLSYETGKDICSENVDACIKSSHEVETKCLEALEPSSVDTVVPEEHKNDDELAHEDKAKIVNDSSETHLDLGKSNKGDVQVIRKQMIYMIKVPKFAGEDLWARTQDAQVHLDRLTQERDAINVRKQKQRAVCEEYREKFEAARQEEREARAAHGDNKHDLNSVRTMIGKLDKANSVEEIDEMIVRKEKIMEHETISLKQEKLFIKEINELKAQRKQLCSNMGSKAEISEAFNKKDHIHEQHKTLKKDSQVLFNNLKSLEESTRKLQKSYEDEREILRKLTYEFRVANDLRQKAYMDWVELRAEPGKKNKYFFMYRRDRGTAQEYLSTGDMEGLQLHCNNQVEMVLGMWNKDDDFRKLYVEANKFSTLRRLGTHDGRRLGPEEDAPVIPSNFNKRPTNPSPLTVSSPEMPVITSEAAHDMPVPVAVPEEEDSFPVLPSPQISKHTKSKASASSSLKETTAAPVSDMEDVKHVEMEKARLMEELELARKAKELARREEELREERAAAEKERLRLEQKAKAKEAEERKKRKAEKAQGRAEFKARKEAEMKEKKKAKKDKKNGATPLDSANGEGNSTAIDTDSNISENTRDGEVSLQTAPRRISRPAVAMRQINRIEPMPLPLRNRGRRKMRQYILVGVIAVLSVVALILAIRYIQLPSSRSLHP